VHTVVSAGVIPSQSLTLTSSETNVDQLLCTSMPPKGGNAKKETGRAKKAENEAKKADAAAAERVSGISSEAKLS
jgi:hypothetical protein